MHRLPRYSLESWDEIRWQGERAAWSKLLENSRADPLFMSFEWQWHWWNYFGKSLAAQLQLFALRDAQGALAGIAPLYRVRARRRGLEVESVQLIGNSFRDRSTVISECLDFIVPSQDGDECADTLVNHLQADLQWNEFVAVWVREDSALAAALGRNPLRAYLRNQDAATGYSIDLRAGFPAWLAQLSASARRRLFNMRTRLERRGAVQLRTAGLDELPDMLGQIDRFHARRWGGALFSGAARAFHLDVARDLAARGALHVSVLEVGGRGVSVFYDYRLGDRQYNLQMGFDDGFDAGLSPGLLHLGYVLERCAAGGVGSYELLVGEGRRTNYKARYASERFQVTTLQGLRGGSALLGRGYDAAARLRRGLRRA